jgi:hypothetical protein
MFGYTKQIILLAVLYGCIFYCEGRTEILGVRKQSAWENIWTKDGYYVRRNFMIYTEHSASLIKGGGNGLMISSNSRIWY